jgi:hypothetical protein
MFRSSRRQFFQDVGRGMLVASVGYGVALDCGFTPAWADDEPGELKFGALEPLVVLMQDTPADVLQPKLIEMLKTGTSLHDLVCAAALANARSFGGEDYIGFHTLMALGPAYSMASLLPESQRALPVLKVLYRNTNRIQEIGGHAAEALHHVVTPATLAADQPAEEQLRNAIRGRDRSGAEGILAAIAQSSPEAAYNALLVSVDDSAEVHRVVLAHRAWDMLSIVGMEHAQTMLRQSLRYCVKQEENSAKYSAGLRELLPKLLDQYSLAGRSAGTRAVDDAWIDQFSQNLFTAAPETAAESVAAALAEGIRPEDIGEAIALTANQIVLRDAGRTGRQVQPNKPEGSVHGDSHGVHASDSAHAWRGIARFANPRNAAAALVLGGWQVARDRANGGPSFLEWRPRPHSDQLDKVGSQDAETLLTQLDGAIRESNQEYACALVHRYGEQGYPERPVFDVLLKYAISEDGQLHAEKYYRTTADEFAALRPAFRWREVVGLARVTASEYGRPAPGVAEARQMLGVS